MEEQEKINLFISYAHADAECAAFDDFKKYIIEADQLSNYINPWTDGEIKLGSKWNEVIKQNLEKADIVILVISQSFLNSKYIKTELKIAFENEEKSKCKVIPLFFESLTLTEENKFLENQGFPSGPNKIQDFDAKKRGKKLSEFQEKILKLAQEIIKNRKGKADRNSGLSENSKSPKFDHETKSERANQPNDTQNDCKFFAIIIVNYEYEFIPEKNISNIKTNLNSLKKTFITNFKIPEENIIVLENKTSYELNEKLGGLIRNRSKDSTLFVYYSGHGIPDSEDFYWATKDTNFEEDNSKVINTGTAFEASKIRKFLDKSPAVNKILVCDCCYAEELLKGKQFMNIEGYMKQKVELINTFYLFSSEAKMESFYPVNEPEKATYFTDAFVKAFQEELKDGKREITIGNIYDKTATLLREVRSIENPIPTPIKQPNDHSLDNIELFKNPNKLSKSAITSRAKRAALTTGNSANEIKTMEDAIKQQRRVFEKEVELATTPEELNKALEKALEKDEQMRNYIMQQEETKSIEDPLARRSKKIELTKANPEMFHINKFITIGVLSNAEPKDEKTKNSSR